jgi:uncharacterized Ntn-hydrolase superfamily protein
MTCPPLRLFGYATLLALPLLIGGLALNRGAGKPAATDPIRTNTWSIAAIDPATGEVGVAGASCVELSSVVGLAALAPGKGAASTQAMFSLENRNRVFELLQQGLPAAEIIAQVTDPAVDPDSATRQYGVVTLTDGQIHVAGFTGADNQTWAGDRQDVPAAVSIQGNILENEAVVENALAAFKSDKLGPVALSDRLLRALEAGSAAGGDKRCNMMGYQQTAAAAFIAVARADQPAFAAPQLDGYNPAAPDAPWLYLSVTEPARLGANPLLKLRREYDAWRVGNLPPCPRCNLLAYPAPEGGAGRTIYSLVGLVGGLLLMGLGAWGLSWWGRRHPKKNP